MAACALGLVEAGTTSKEMGLEPALRPIAAMSSVNLELSERFLSACRRLATADFGRITVFLEKLTIDCFGVADAGLIAF